MIKFWNYFKISSLLLVLLILFAGLILFFFGDNADRLAAAIGFFISYINTLVGFAVIQWAHKKSLNEFMAFFYGGMIFRFLLIFASLFVLIVGFDMSQISLIVSLCVSYFIFLGLEVFIIHKHSELD